MRETLIALTMAAPLTLGSSLGAFAQGTGTGTTGSSSSAQGGNEGNGFDWGWLGPLCLAGLAPLFMRRGSDDRH